MVNLSDLFARNGSTCRPWPRVSVNEPGTLNAVEVFKFVCVVV